MNREVKLAPEVAAKLPAGEETLKRLADRLELRHDGPAAVGRAVDP